MGQHFLDFGSKKLWVQKKILSPKKFGSNKILIKKNFDKKKLRPAKNESKKFGQNWISNSLDITDMDKC